LSIQEATSKAHTQQPCPQAAPTPAAAPGFSNIQFVPTNPNGTVPAAGFDALGDVDPPGVVVVAEMRPLMGGMATAGMPSPQPCPTGSWRFTFGPLAPGNYVFHVEVQGGFPSSDVNITLV
jgi:hypothetical protein